jgi:dodecin
MPVTKIIEVVGTSTKGSDDAVREAVRAASRSIRGISEAQVMSVRCTVADGDVAQWHALVKLAFPVEARG